MNGSPITVQYRKEYGFPNVNTLYMNGYGLYVEIYMNGGAFQPLAAPSYPGR